METIDRKSSSDEAKERFLKDIKNHSMNIELDSGVYRSIKFSRDNSSVYYFRITTWPGHLCISGDMGTYVFSRLEDMFQFFRGDELSINAGYWTQKLQSISCFGSKEGHVKEFDAEATAENVRDQLTDDEGNLSHRFQDLLDCTESREAMQVLEEADVYDAWEYLSTKYTTHVLWCLYAIRWAIIQYDKQMEIAA